MIFPEYWDFKELLYATFRPAFLLLDFIGIIFIAIGYYPGNYYSSFFATVGSTFITIGLTLPIALYYQLQHSTESFRILKACNTAGIQAVIVSRLDDNENFRQYIKSAVVDTKEILLLGVAFRSLFNPSNEHTTEMKAALQNPDVCIKLLILDSESVAAKRRQQIEIGGQTLEDIKATINTGLVSTIKTRLDHIREHHGDFALDPNASDFNGIRKKINLEVKQYKYDPALLILCFDGSMFVESYHFGRPEKLVPFASCIGKYVPILQFRNDSKGYAFFKAHFNYVWDHSEDITHSVIQKTLDAIEDCN